MTLPEALTLALADEFGCSPERIAQWLAEHRYTLPDYLRRHGLGEYAEALGAMPQERPAPSCFARSHEDVSPPKASVAIARSGI